MDKSVNKNFNLEQSCGRFSASLAKELDDAIKPLAFCSPASFRDPEVDSVWHPKIQERGFIFLLCAQVKPLAKAFLVGLWKFLMGRFGRADVFLVPGCNVVAIGPQQICSVTDDSVETSYLNPKDTKNVNWIVVSEGRSVDGLTKTKVTHVLGILLRAWIRVSLAVKQEAISDWILASMLVFRWILSLTWAEQLTYLTEIRHSISVLRPNKIFCLHEAHPLSRLVWAVCNSTGIESETVQHASINRPKLWYFPTCAEVESGQCFPDRFFVYSVLTRRLLRTYLPSTTVLPLACGPRYSHWASPITLTRDEQLPSRVMFVTSLASWDNAIVFEALEKIRKYEQRNYDLYIRLHPNPIMSSRQKRKLNSWLTNGDVIKSTGSVFEGLSKASIVVGAVSTILGEASLMGCNTVGLTSNDFLYSVESADVIVKIDDFGPQTIEYALGIPTQETKEYFIESLGLRNEVYRLLR